MDAREGETAQFVMSAPQIRRVGDKLVFSSDSITEEFQRKPQHLSEIDRWKASELRQFCLYTGTTALNRVPY